jgi:hypothetical protein
MVIAAAPASGGPGWTDILTAIGTVGAVAAAVGIALWSEWRSGKRLKAERERSDRLLAEERQRSREALEEERRLAREREQLVEAYAVQVLAAEGRARAGLPDDEWYTVAIVVNRGTYTINSIDVRFWFNDGSLMGYWVQQAVPQPGVADAMLADLKSPTFPDSAGPFRVVLSSSWRLAPWDAGMRFVSNPVPLGRLPSSYPIVRWTDRWGTRWQYRLGEVQRIRDDEPWERRVGPSLCRARHRVCSCRTLTTWLHRLVSA